jgi:hypothetical protein
MEPATKAFVLETMKEHLEEYHRKHHSRMEHKDDASEAGEAAKAGPAKPKGGKKNAQMMTGAALKKIMKEAGHSAEEMKKMTGKKFMVHTGRGGHLHYEEM